MFVIALASSFNGYLVGMAIGGLGFGVYDAVDPAVPPALLAVAGGRYGVLFAVAGVGALLGAAAVVPVRAVRWAPVRGGLGQRRACSRPSSVARRTASRRLFTPSLA